MRRQGLLFAALSLAVACSDALPVPPPPPVDWHSFEVVRTTPRHASPPPAKEQSVAERYIAALASPSMKDLGALLDENAHCTLPSGDDARGRDDVVTAHRSLVASFDDVKFGATGIWRTDRAQIVAWTVSGRATRPYLGAPAAPDKTILAQGLSVLVTRSDGLVTDVHVHLDPGLVKAELGVGPKVLVDRSLPAWPRDPPRVVGPDVVEDDNDLKIVRSSLDALANGDDAGYVAPMADDVDVRTEDRADPIRGKDAVRAYARALHGAIAQLDTTVRDAYSVGPFVVVEYEISGAQIGPIGWIPLQALRVPHIDVAEVVELSGGHITHITRYDNRGALLLPPPAADAAKK